MKAMNSSRKVLMVVSVFLGPLIATVPAFGHAVLVNSSPKDKQVLNEAPKEVILTFGSKVEKKVFTAALLGADGQKITLPPAPQKDEPPEQLVLPMPSLKAGTYRLQFQVLASDGHTSPGQLQFTIKDSKP